MEQLSLTAKGGSMIEDLIAIRNLVKGLKNAEFDTDIKALDKRIKDLKKSK